MSLVHRQIAVGPFQCNCHIVMDEATRRAVVIDPGDEPDRVIEEVKDLGATVDALLHTHCHVDHIRGTRQVKEETGARILIHSGDEWLYRHLKDQFAATLKLFGVPMGTPEETLPVDGHLTDGQEIPLGKAALRVIHTPGHTPGSCCFHLTGGDRPAVFSGDTLFQGSVGRTDLWGGSTEEELGSIRKRLLTLEGGTRVFPGHGPATTIRAEKDSNPFLQ